MGVPPVSVCGAAELLRPPQATPTPRQTRIASAQMPVQRRSRGAPAVTIPANSMPVAAASQPNPAIEEAFNACGGVVVTVRVAVALDAFTVTELVLSEHVIRLDDGGGVQLRSTVPAKPLVGSTVMVEVPGLPGEAIVTTVPPTEKLGVATKPGQAVTRLCASMDPSPLATS